MINSSQKSYSISLLVIILVVIACFFYLHRLITTPEPTVDDRTPEAVEVRVGLYAGEGSWEENIVAIANFLDSYEYEWSLFDEGEESLATLGDNYDLIWFPGGFAAEYRYGVEDHPAISGFIDNGGGYIGSCAGAYYAAEVFSWKGTDYPYPLAVFRGRAAGPLNGMITWGEPAQVKLDPLIPLNRNFDTFLSMYYLDGPYFEPIDYSDFPLVLARYSANGEPAVIAGRSGEGKFLLIGPHPELGDPRGNDSLFNLEGGTGAQWAWLNAVLKWFSSW